MPDVTSYIPRSDLTADQRRRLGAVQAAKHVVWGTHFNSIDKSQLIVQHVDDLLLLAKYIETGDTS
jgi:hypothetical protein